MANTTLTRSLDSLLAILWRLCRGVGAMAMDVARAIADALRRSARRGHPDHLLRRCGDWLAALGLPALLELAAAAAANLARHLDRSAVARRWFFLALFLLACLWLYPPSHWGPWHHYQRGVASHYAQGFHFRRTAIGEIFLPGKVCAAHNTLPLGTTIKVVNRNNGRSLVLRVADRGPLVKGRILDLSTAAAKKLDIVRDGTAIVDIYTHR